MNIVLDISKCKKSLDIVNYKARYLYMYLLKTLFNDFLKCYRTNDLKVIIVTDILFYYNDYAEYFSRRLEMQAILRYLLLYSQLVIPLKALSGDF